MKRLALTGLLAAVGLGLVGCGGGQHPLVSGGTRQNLRGVNLRNGAAFVSPERLAIVTAGSGSCPAVPDKLVVLGPDTIRIHLTEGSWQPTSKSHRNLLVPHPPPPGYACTADLTTTPMLVAINPKQINVHHALTIRFYYYNSKKPEIRTAPPL